MPLSTASPALTAAHQTPSRGKLPAAKPQYKPPAGISLRKVENLPVGANATDCWQECDARTFNVRGPDYIRSKVKVGSQGSLYRLAAVDMFSFDKKEFHVARKVQLPGLPKAYTCDGVTPPILVINIQLPTYQATMFGSHDGPGHSIVFCFVLPEGFDSSKFKNQGFMRLFHRFVRGEKEADGTPTRDHFKLIPRVANPEEWAQKGPLSSAEYKLLNAYHAKPLLIRPQQHFFSGPGYMEVDLDIHSFAYLARKALGNFISRLMSAVYEYAFVVQGNGPDELPEQVLGCARMYRTDFLRWRPFNAWLRPPSRAAAEQQPGMVGAMQHTGATAAAAASEGVQKDDSA